MAQNIDDRHDELAALARLVIYARGCAELIQAKDVEERLVYALDAIKSELGDARDASLVDFFEPSNTPSTMQ
ncbi:hypothetical protein ASG19_07170 [Rhizobium sp. Leaf306]|uniref:hypothetical protein n=1 Tax=Rhizobium sp. Leaf306 TaxID=1736330 RepID=UPI000713F177|nr:hypothetical protein [Rhizobium sp. Leaf306]KQQ38784.1 hypothetical protein ASG19_07170 [Rhizobium sp. Leaf306]